MSQTQEQIRAEQARFAQADKPPIHRIMSQAQEMDQQMKLFAERHAQEMKLFTEQNAHLSHIAVALEAIALLLPSLTQPNSQPSPTQVPPGDI